VNLVATREGTSTGYQEHSNILGVGERSGAVHLAMSVTTNSVAAPTLIGSSAVTL